VNQWWISDDTRYSYKPIHDAKRLKRTRKTQYGSQVDVEFSTALNEAIAGLTNVVKTHGQGSLFALLSPMMACEEAWLLGTWIRSLDPQAVLVLGPVPTTGEDEVFKDPRNGKETFRIKAEKVPNAAGIRRIIETLGGPNTTFDQIIKPEKPELKKLKGGWIVGGYLSNWIGTQTVGLFRGTFRVVQDILPNSLTDNCDVLLPAAAWAEKDGSWENFAGKIQSFEAAIAPPEGARREGDVYYKLLGRTGFYNAEAVRQEMGGPFATTVQKPAPKHEEPAFEFVEL
jgi:NADH-quinone oxidoreductase subunit G